MLISTRLNLPHTATTTSIPASWVTDGEVSMEARGLLGAIVSFVAEPGVRITSDWLDSGRRAGDPRVKGLLPELIAAGYLIPATQPDHEHYELVHPDRLPPLLA